MNLYKDFNREGRRQTLTPRRGVTAGRPISAHSASQFGRLWGPILGGQVSGSKVEPVGPRCGGPGSGRPGRRQEDRMVQQVHGVCHVKTVEKIRQLGVRGLAPAGKGS